MAKNFKIKKDDIVSGLASGIGCMATDRIVVDGCCVGYMRREKPIQELDSGWRFFAGDESESYMKNDLNHGVYALNTIANYDIDILEFLDSHIGSQFERDDFTNRLVIAQNH